MDHTADELPSAAVNQDNAEGRAPDPREHYDSPETLAGDVTLPLARRSALLREWKYSLEQRLEAESEGMGASAPTDAAQIGGLSAELLRVAQACQTVSTELELAAG